MDNNKYLKVTGTEIKIKKVLTEYRDFQKCCIEVTQKPLPLTVKIINNWSIAGSRTFNMTYIIMQNTVNYLCKIWTKIKTKLFFRKKFFWMPLILQSISNYN